MIRTRWRKVIKDLRGNKIRIVLVEGIFVGIISWLLGGLAAYPIGKLLNDTVGIAFMESPLTYVFSTPGALGWRRCSSLLPSPATYPLALLPI